MQASKQNRITFGLLSVGYILLGLLMVIDPALSGHIISYLLGGIAVVVGLVRVAFYFVKEEERGQRNDLAVGIVLLALGVYLFTRPEGLMDLLSVLMGFAVLYDSIVKLQNSFDLKRGKLRPWWLFLIIAFATAVLGVLLIVSPFSAEILQYFFGAVLIADGLLNLVTLGFMLVWQRRQKKAEADGLDDADAEDAAGPPLLAQVEEDGPTLTATPSFEGSEAPVLGVPVEPQEIPGQENAE